MRRIIIVSALLISAGVMPSCKKETRVSPTATIEHSMVWAKKDLATAD